MFSSKFECADHESEGISWRSPSVRPQSAVKVVKLALKRPIFYNILQKIKNGQPNEPEEQPIVFDDSEEAVRGGFKNGRFKSSC
jgi:hypothetical protein